MVREVPTTGLSPGTAQPPAGRLSAPDLLVPTVAVLPDGLVRATGNTQVLSIWGDRSSACRRDRQTQHFLTGRCSLLVGVQGLHKGLICGGSLSPCVRTACGSGAVHAWQRGYPGCLVLGGPKCQSRQHCGHSSPLWAADTSSPAPASRGSPGQSTCWASGPRLSVRSQRSHCQFEEDLPASSPHS